MRPLLWMACAALPASGCAAPSQEPAAATAPAVEPPVLDTENGLATFTDVLIWGNPAPGS